MQKAYAFISVTNSLLKCGAFDEVYPLVLGENEKTIEYAKDKIGDDKIVYSKAGAQEHDRWILHQVFSYGKTASRYGKKIALIIADLDEVTVRNLNKAVEIASSGTSYQNGGSLTIISFADIENEAFKYAKRTVDARLDLTFIPFNGTYRINAQNCYSFSAGEKSELENAVLEKLYGSTDALETAYEKLKLPTDYDALLKVLANQ